MMTKINVAIPKQWESTDQFYRADPMSGRIVPSMDAQIAANPLNKNGGYINEEWQRELYGFRAQQVFREMRDSCEPIAAVIKIVENMASKVVWAFEPSTAKGASKRKAKQWADFCTSCMRDMQISWTQLITQMVSSIWTGFYYGEIVYKKRDGEKTDQRTTSQYNDGLYGWRKFVNIGAQNVFQWAFTDDQKDLTGIWQQTREAVPVAFIPIQKALHIAISSEVDNPEGRSALRPAWTSYRNLKNLLNIEGIGYEKDVGGFPMATVPATALSANATADERAMVAEIQKSLAQIRRGARSYVVFPSSVDELGQNSGYSLSFIGSSTGSANSAINIAIMRYYKQIALAMLADFLYLGSDKAGSYALSSDKSSMFLENIRGFFDKVADEFNRQAVASLMRLNGVPSSLWPQLTYTGLDAPDIEKIGAYIDHLVRAGINVSDEETSLWLRSLAGLPAVIAAADGPENAPTGDSGDNPAKPTGKMRVAE